MAQKNDSYNFAEAVQKLEDITRWLQDNELDLEKGLEKVKEGKKIVDECKKNLTDVENEFIEVKKEFERAEPVAIRFPDEEEDTVVTEEQVTVQASKKKTISSPSRLKDSGFIPLQKQGNTSADALDDDDDLPF